MPTAHEFKHQYSHIGYEEARQLRRDTRKYRIPLKGK